MISFIIWIIGLVLAIKAVLEIMKWDIDGVKKLLVAILILITNTILFFFFVLIENFKSSFLSMRTSYYVF